MARTSGIGHALSSRLLSCGGKSDTPPYGPWEHAPPHVWTDQSNSAATQDEAEDEAEVCVLCCQKRSTVAVCDECKEHLLNVLTPTLVGPMLFVKYNTYDS